MALLYFASAALSLWLTRGINGIAMMWPGSGLLLSALLLVQRASVPGIVLGAGVGSVMFGLVVGDPPVVAVGTAGANLIESIIGWWLLRGQGEPPPSFVTPVDLLRFGGAITVAAAVGTLIAWMVMGRPSAEFAASWFMTDLLGMCLVTPVVLLSAASLSGRDADHDPMAGPGQATLWLGLVAIVTLAVFSQSIYPLLFLPPVALLTVTYRLGPFGAASGMLVIAAIGSVATALGHGPLMILHGTRAGVALFLQFYLLVLLATALPMAAVLATRNRLMREVGESNRLLMLAERAAQMGHWRLAVARGRMFWSPEIYRLYGVGAHEAPSMERLIDGLHSDDRTLARAAIAAAVAMTEAEHEFMFDARLLQPDGAMLHVRTRGHARRAGDGSGIELFGVVQDVSDRVHAAQALEAARNAAEVAADTDHLTGLASRRRALRLLDDMLADARATGRALSVAVFDIDHFKTVNDLHGHLAGDVVLQRVASAATHASRIDDVVGRLGGEEFVLLLPGADQMAATAVAERVRLAIGADRGVDVAADPRVTISIGVAEMREDATATNLLNRADRALYEAKRAGRNRMRVAA